MLIYFKTRWHSAKLNEKLTAKNAEIWQAKTSIVICIGVKANQVEVRNEVGEVHPPNVFLLKGVVDEERSQKKFKQKNKVMFAFIN